VNDLLYCHCYRLGGTTRGCGIPGALYLIAANRRLRSSLAAFGWCEFTVDRALGIGDPLGRRQRLPLQASIPAIVAVSSIASRPIGSIARQYGTRRAGAATSATRSSGAIFALSYTTDQ
jgi:hypothetical protein